MDYYVYGNNGKTITLNKALGVGTTAANVSLVIGQNSIVNSTVAQTYGEGSIIKAGVLQGTGTNATAAFFGIGAITIGDSTAGQNAELKLSAWNTQTNAITIASGSGTRTITGDWGVSGQVPIFSGAVTLNNNLTLSATGNGGLRINGIINDGASSYGLTIDNAGTSSIRLNQANTFDGGILIKRGILEQNTAATALGTGTVTIGDSSGSYSATLQAGGTGFTATNAITIASGSSGTKTILNTSGNSFIYSGIVTLNDNLTLAANGTGNLTLSNAVNGAAGSQTITNNGSGTNGVTISGLLTGVETVKQNSASSQLSLTNGSSPSSALVVASGQLNWSPGTGAGYFATGGVTLGDSSNLDSILNLSGRTSVSTVGINVVGAGAHTIIGNHTNTGQIHLLNSAITLNSNDLTIRATGAAGYRVSGGVTGTGNLVFQANSASGNQIDIRSSLNNVGTVTNNGTGAVGLNINGGSFGSIGANVTSLIQDSATSAFNLNAAIASASTATAQVKSGTMYLYDANSLRVGNEVLVGSSGTLDVRVSNTIAGLSNISGAGGIVTNFSALDDTLTLGGTGSYSFSGVIQNGTTNKISLIKSGVGTQTLNGTNTYTGNTTVSNGTLALGATGSIATSPVITVSTGATLDVSAQLSWMLATGQILNGTGTVLGSSAASDAIVINGIHRPGNSPGLQTFNGSTTYNSSSVFDWDLIANSTSGRGTNYDGVDIAGSLKIISGATFNLVLNGAGSTVNFTNSFWTSTQTWLVMDPTGTLTGMFALGSISTDSLGALASTYGSFSLTNTNGDVNLLWTPIPESSTSLLAAASILCLLHRRRK